MIPASIKSQPLFKTVLVFFLGIICGWHLFNDIPFWFALFFLLFFLLIAVFNIKKNSLLILIVYFLLIFFAGFNYAAFKQILFQENQIVHIILPGKDFTFAARLLDDDFDNNARLRKIKLSVCYIGGKCYKPGGRFWLKANNLPNLNKGDLVFGSASFRMIPPQRNPPDFDFAAFSRRQMIYGILETNDYPLSAQRNDSLPLQLIRSARNDILAKIDKYFTKTEGEILKALTIGFRADLPDDVSQQLRYSGLWHLVSLSGLHLGIIAGLAALFFSFIGLSAEKRNLLIIIFIWLFVLIAETRAPLLRSAIVITLFLGSRYFSKWIDLWNLLALSALLIVLFHPAELFAPGFQLTYAAVAFIMAGGRCWRYPQTKIFNQLRNKYLAKTLLNGFSAALFASLGTAPLMAYHFAGIPMASVPASIVGVPLVGFILSVFPCFYLATFLWKALAAVLTNSLWVCLKAFEKLIEFFSPPWQYLHAPGFNAFMLIALYFTLILLIMRKRIWLLIALVLLNLLIWRQIFRIPQAEVTFFDVGQGASALVQIPPDETIMIDTGPASAAFNPMKKTIIPFLRQRNIPDIDYLILSHSDNDHIGGTEYLLQNYPVRQVILGQGFTDFTASAPVKYGRAGDWLKAGGALMLFFNPYRQTEDNAGSLVVKLIYGETEILFPGDIEAGTEKLLLGYGMLLDSDLLLAAHHGSRYSSSLDFLQQVTPQWTVISCGRNNRYGHPHAETLSRLNQCASTILRTDEIGAVSFRFTKNNIFY